MLNIRDLSWPELPTQENYEDALKLGLESFGRKDPGRVASYAGVSYEDRKVIIPHLDKHIVLDTTAGTFTIQEKGEEAAIWLAILAIHYLNNAPGRQPSGKLKHFREFKEGHFYEPAFNRSAKEVLIKFFGANPAGMVSAGEKLGGKILRDADASVELAYFPYLPITCLVWKGDDEFPPEATVLFDQTAELFFSAEDMAVAGEMAVLELVKAAR